MPKKIIIVGAGQNGLVAANIISYNKNYKINGFLDDRRKIKGQWLGSVADFKKYIKNYYFFVSIGDNKTRERIFNLLKINKAKFINAIHPTAFREKGVILGENVMVGACSYVNIHTLIGDNTIINNGCIIEHDNTIGHHCHLAPGVITAGEVKIKRGVFIGIGSIIRDRAVIGKNCFIGAGSNVIKDTKDNLIYYGNPAKLIKII